MVRCEEGVKRRREGGMVNMAAGNIWEVERCGHGRCLGKGEERVERERGVGVFFELGWKVSREL